MPRPYEAKKAANQHKRGYSSDPEGPDFVDLQCAGNRLTEAVVEASLADATQMPCKSPVFSTQALVESPLVSAYPFLLFGRGRLLMVKLVVRSWLKIGIRVICTRYGSLLRHTAAAPRPQSLSSEKLF